MLRTYKYLLRPDPEQAKQLDFLLWQSRLVTMPPSSSGFHYQETGKGISYGAQWTHFRDLRRDNPDTLGQVNASSLQHLLRRLDKSFAAFFRRLKAGRETRLSLASKVAAAFTASSTPTGMAASCVRTSRAAVVLRAERWRNAHVLPPGNSNRCEIKHAVIKQVERPGISA